MASAVQVPQRSGAEVDLAKKLDALHQMLYMRGGIRPVNAAIEELSKLLLLTIAAERFPHMTVGSYGTLESVVDPMETSVEAAKLAFTLVVAHPELAGLLPGGQRQPVWPLDEPLRVSRVDVLSEALRVLSRTENGHENSVLDPLGTAFDVFLSGKYEHAGGLGTHLTPTTVAVAMAEVGLSLLQETNKNKTLRIADPCCGTGRFLVAALEALQSVYDEDRLGLSFPEFVSRALLGADQSPSAVAKARVNLLSYGIRQPFVFTVEDSITDTSLDKERGSIGLILTNPPFGEGKYDSRVGIGRTAEIFPELRHRTRIDPALAFVARCLDLVADGGVVGIVLPDGITEGEPFRSNLLRSHRLFPDGFGIEAVISLPSVTFSLGGTTAKTSAVFLRKGPALGRRVFLGRADHVGYIKQAGSAAVDPGGDDLPTIANSLASAIKANGDRPAEVLRRDPLVVAILRDDPGSLDIGRMDPDAIEARETLRREGGVELHYLLRPVTRRRRQLLPDGAPFISVLHVDDLGVVAWRESKNYRPSTPGIVANAGEILISLLNPRKFRATVIPERYPAVHCSAEFGVFETNRDPYAVLALLQHPLVRAQVAPLGRGTSSSRRRIEPQDILNLLVPCRDESWHATTGAAVGSSLELCAMAEDQLIDCYST